MRFFFADDARQDKPSREGMGPLVASGGAVLSADQVHKLEQAIGEVCVDFGFPRREEFKWSPHRDQWMWANLVDDRRRDFFLAVLRLAETHQARVLVIVEDRRYKTATTGAPSPEADVTRMFLERADHYLRWSDVNDRGVVIVDRPGGGRREEDRFLLECLETLQAGTEYVKPERIALPVLSARSDLVRLAQLADLVTGCTLSCVAGEKQFAPPIFEAIRPLMLGDGMKTGGVGLKIHPDFVCANLYHWLLGDSHFWKMGVGVPFPWKGVRTHVTRIIGDRVRVRAIGSLDFWRAFL